MIRRLRRSIHSIAAASAAAIVFFAPASAHDGVARIFVEPAAILPGGAVAVRGDLPTTSPIELFLVGPGGQRIELGTVEELIDGHFELLLGVPVDTPSGTWSLEAGEIGAAPLARASLEIGGDAAAGEGGQGPRDEDDPLLVALPSGWQQALSASQPPAVSSGATVGASQEPLTVPAWLAIVGAGLACLGGFGIARRSGPVRAAVTDPGPALAGDRASDVPDVDRPELP